MIHGRTAAEAPAPAGGSRRLALAASLGNAIEWYDFAVYGALASTLARVFFPAAGGEAALQQSFAVFAIGFLMRPVGSLVLGPIGDRLGRRQLLILSVSLMAIASTAIGLLPSQDQWGPLSGRLLILLRMLQGFALGGSTPVRSPLWWSQHRRSVGGEAPAFRPPARCWGW